MPNEEQQRVAPFFRAGGTLDSGAPSYVERDADREILRALGDGDYCYVLTSRQMGKSSLYSRSRTRLGEKGFAVAYVDLTIIGRNLSTEQWYNDMLEYLGEDLGLEDEIDEFLDAPHGGTPLKRWVDGLCEVFLKELSAPIVLFIDEIDFVRQLPFDTDEFFASIRSLYNRRNENPELKRLSFCLLGVASPTGLIKDSRMTPFNIGRRIELSDFTENQALSLAEGFSSGAEEEREAMVRRIHFWTGGQPYLTQRLCTEVELLGGGLDGEAIDGLCEMVFLSEHAQSSEVHFDAIRKALLGDESRRDELLSNYIKLLRGKPVADNDLNPTVTSLKLSGIVRGNGKVLEIKNRIYEQNFDLAWARAHQSVDWQRVVGRWRRVAGFFGLALIVALAAVFVMLYLQESGKRAESESARKEGLDHQKELKTIIEKQREKAVDDSHLLTRAKTDLETELAFTRKSHLGSIKELRAEHAIERKESDDLKKIFVDAYLTKPELLSELSKEIKETALGLISDSLDYQGVVQTMREKAESIDGRLDAFESDLVRMRPGTVADGIDELRQAVAEQIRLAKLRQERLQELIDRDGPRKEAASKAVRGLTDLLFRLRSQHASTHLLAGRACRQQGSWQNCLSSHGEGLGMVGDEVGYPESMSASVETLRAKFGLLLGQFHYDRGDYSESVRALLPANERLGGLMRSDPNNIQLILVQAELADYLHEALRLGQLSSPTVPSMHQGALEKALVRLGRAAEKMKDNEDLSLHRAALHLVLGNQNRYEGEFNAAKAEYERAQKLIKSPTVSTDNPRSKHLRMRVDRGIGLIYEEDLDETHAIVGLKEARDRIDNAVRLGEEVLALDRTSRDHEIQLAYTRWRLASLLSDDDPQRIPQLLEALKPFERLAKENRLRKIDRDWRAEIEKELGLFEGELGMKFLPIVLRRTGGTLMSIYETTNAQFQEFVKSTGTEIATVGAKSPDPKNPLTWLDTGFGEGPPFELRKEPPAERGERVPVDQRWGERPVVCVSHADIQRFLEWLNVRAKKSGSLPAGFEYRLPSDEEWSQAANLADETGTSPEERDDNKPKDARFVWGDAWPPPTVPRPVANIAGSESVGRIGGEMGFLGNYADPFVFTAPVGAFPPNRYGFYDLAGNVFEICQDKWNFRSKKHVRRGCSWDEFELEDVRSDNRKSIRSDEGDIVTGFRIVIAPE